MNIKARSQEVFDQEIKALGEVKSRLSASIIDAVETILHCKGKVVITGIGKTGIIGKKIAASMASTGTPTIFMNAAVAMHGDLGMVTSGDVVMMISNSGESSEVLNIMPPIRKIGCQIIAMTGNIKSSLAQGSDIVLDVNVESEAGKIGLAPTTSTTATIVMGDAITVCLMELRDFKPENFALYHPGGALGRRMLTKVRDCMSSVVPMVEENTFFTDVVAQLTSSKLGITMVSKDNVVTGIITDGDIRRAVQHYQDLHALKAKDFLTVGFKQVYDNDMSNDAIDLMDRYKITTLAVFSHTQKDQIIGILHIHHIYGFKN